MNEANLLAELIRLEEQLLQRANRMNAGFVDSLLASDFREFGTSGTTYTRDDVLTMLQAEAPTAITADDFNIQVISPEAALLTYTSTKLVSDSDPVKALRSSLWILDQGRWQMLFHQGTRTS